MTSGDKPACFVIMPFGRKIDADGDEIDFDVIYQELIKESVRDLGFEAVRGDEIGAAGSIVRDMLNHIANDEVAIVDVTTLNPNVFYELGARHALKPSTTIIIKRQGVKLPFNILLERVIEYPRDNGNYADARAKIKEYVLRGTQRGRQDSPIFEYVQKAQAVETARISRLDEYRYRMIGQPEHEIRAITGDLRNWRKIDVWVNSENTNMQMARFYDNSLSAIIRYEGAAKNQNGEIVEDTIELELRSVVDRESVTPGTVYVTGPGALATKGVRKIFHAASVQGVPGSGYLVMPNVERCVTVSLERMDDDQHKNDRLNTIVFPMLGTGNARGRVETIAPRLIQAAVSYFRSYPESQVSTVYFSAWNQRDLDVCLNAFRSSRDLESVPS